MEADTVDGRQADSSAYNLLHFHEFAGQLFIDMKHIFGGLVDALALSGKLKLLLAAVDQERAEVFLHCSSLLTHCGLCYPVESRCFRKAFCLYKVCEYFEVIDLHIISDFKHRYNAS